MKEKTFRIIGHTDHGITKSQINFIQHNSELLKLKNGEFIKRAVSIPKELGFAPSSLYGPNAGDSIIAENQVFYQNRGKRKGMSRLIRAPKRLAQNLCVIGVKGGVCFTIFGTQSSIASPMEPWDKKFKHLSKNEQKYVVKFWKEHALAYEE